ncbi:MAG: hypothetical protein F6K19_36125 [Cyanothece sp. SIO1E1]|nr:hypothetical protein [Cyanothece sp. SIO1E1]
MNFEPLNPDDVIQTPKEPLPSELSAEQIIKIDSLLEKLKQRLSGKDNKILNWQQEQGLECQVLQPGFGWRKGKARIRVIVEFCPDEPENLGNELIEAFEGQNNG